MSNIGNVTTLQCYDGNNYLLIILMWFFYLILKKHCQIFIKLCFIVKIFGEDLITLTEKCSQGMKGKVCRSRALVLFFHFFMNSRRYLKLNVIWAGSDQCYDENVKIRQVASGVQDRMCTKGTESFLPLSLEYAWSLCVCIHSTQPVEYL